MCLVVFEGKSNIQRVYSLTAFRLYSGIGSI